MDSSEITPLERILRLPAETRSALLDFLAKNTRDLGTAVDAEEKHIERLASLRTYAGKRHFS